MVCMWCGTSEELYKLHFRVGPALRLSECIIRGAWHPTAVIGLANTTEASDCIWLIGFL